MCIFPDARLCRPAIQTQAIPIVAAAHIPAAAAVVDWFFVDIKDMNPSIYKAYTGQDNALVKSNLALLLSLVGAERIPVRVPHIPGFNTDADVQASVAELTAMGVTVFDVFAYKIPTKKV